MHRNLFGRSKHSAMRVLGHALRAVAVIAAALPAAAQAPPLSEMDIVLRSVPRGPIARINSESVPSRDFIDMYLGEVQLSERMKGGPLSEAERVGVGMRTLGMLVEREIMVREAKARGITVADAALEEAWRVELEELAESMRRRGMAAPTEAEVLGRAGVSRHEALEELRAALMVDRLQGALVEEANIRVDDAEVRRRFDERKGALRQPERIHVQQIFIAKPPSGGDAAAEARKRAEAALQRIRAGQRFETVARDASEGALAERGGDPGPMPADRMPPFMVAAARAMQPGDVSEVLESEVGFHVIRLQEIIAGAEADFEQVREGIRNELRAREGLRIAKEFVTRRLESGDYEVRTYLDIDRQLLAHPEVVAELEAMTR